MATIRKRKGKWQAQIRRKGQTVSRTFIQKADAQSWANQTEIEADRKGLPRDQSCLIRLTVADLVTRYRDSVVPSRRGHKNETIIIDAFLRHPIAHIRLSNLTATHFADYRDERLKIVRPATVNRELGLVQHAFEVARREWAIPLVINPVREIAKPKADKARDRRLCGDEWERLIVACQKTRNGMIWPLIRFAVETGMRRGEILNAKWQEVNFTESTLHIPITKNGEPRTIPLTAEAIGILNTQSRNSDRLFPLTDCAVSLSWKRLVKRAKIENLHFHDLRHEAVSRFFERGLSVPEVALISGHKDPRMLFRYTHLRAEDVARKLNGALEKAV